MIEWRYNIRLGSDIFFSYPLKEKIFEDSPYSSVAATTTNQFNEKGWKTGVLPQGRTILPLSISSPNSPKQAGGFTLSKLRASRIAERLKLDDDGGKRMEKHLVGVMGRMMIPYLWMRNRGSRPCQEEEEDAEALADYPLLVEEEDPDWPEDSDGWGFSLRQFFDKITIKNVKKDEDDENYDGENELVWQDDNYIRPIKDITTTEWEETVFKDFSPLIVFVHNRYRRPLENERMRDELEKAVYIIWNCRLPSPRVNPVVELDLVSALQVSIFPELIFTKAGKILYCEKAIQIADELSKIMAFFYYGAAKLPSLNTIGKSEEPVPTI
ncbi:unnamed protein product [Camellia sinensis]